MTYTRTEESTFFPQRGIEVLQVSPDHNQLQTRPVFHWCKATYQIRLNSLHNNRKYYSETRFYTEGHNYLKSQWTGTNYQLDLYSNDVKATYQIWLNYLHNSRRYHSNTIFRMYVWTGDDTICPSTENGEGIKTKLH